MWISVCGPKDADIVFALDSSESLTDADFETEKEFIYNFTKKFKIGSSNVQFGCVTIADHPRTDFYLNSYHQRQQLLDAIQSLTFLRSGTNTAEALKTIQHDMFAHQHGGRHAASHIVIVLTDGMSKNPNETVHAAQVLKHTATVHAIGIGSLINQEELKAIDSNGKPGTVTGFDVLHTMGDYLMEIACPGSLTGKYITGDMPQILQFYRSYVFTYFFLCVFKKWNQRTEKPKDWLFHCMYSIYWCYI